jgi:hypothetical protein
MRVKRRNQPKYAGYRAKKLVDDRRNHFFRYSRLLDEMMARRPWLTNNYTATKLFTRITGMYLDKTGAAKCIDFTQRRTKKSTSPERQTQRESSLDIFTRLTGLTIGKR